MLLAAALAWVLLTITFLVITRADDQARRDCDRSRSQTRPPSAP